MLLFIIPRRVATANPTSIQIHLMLLFIKIVTIIFSFFPNSNTSHVIVYRAAYPPQSPESRIQIHLMLLFIAFSRSADS